MRAMPRLLFATGLLLLLGLGTASAANIGPDDRQVSFTGLPDTPTTDAVSPAVTFDPLLQRYLTVWSSDETDGVFRIRGRLLSGASGEGVGESFFISPDQGPLADAREPVVAFDPNSGNYLVVWSSDGLQDGAFEIMGQAVSGQGQLVGPVRRLSDMGTNDSDVTFDAVDPDLTWVAGAGEMVVVWSGDDDVGTWADGHMEIYGQRIAGATGGEVGTNDFLISNGVDTFEVFDAYEPAVTAGGGGGVYAVAWESDLFDDGAHTPEVFVQIMDLNTAVGTAVMISYMGLSYVDPYTANNPDLIYAASSDEYVVVWDGEPAAGVGRGVYGRRFSGATPVGPNILMSDAVGVPSGQFREACHPSISIDPISEYWFVAWQADLDDGLAVHDFEVWSRRFDDVGNPVDATVQQISNMDPSLGPVAGAGKPAVAANSFHDYKLIVWSGDLDTSLADQHEIFAQAWSDGAVSAVDETPLAGKLVLFGASPNPFNPATTIAWEMPRAAPVTLKIHDVAGRLVRRLLSGANHEAGRQSIVWNGQNDRGHSVAAGVYLYSLETPQEKLTGRMSLVK